MQRHRERLRKSGFVKGDFRLHGKCLFLCDDNLVTERALDMRKAHRTAVKANVETLIRMSFDAVAAVTTRVARVDRHPIADADSRDTLADGDDGSSHFVPKDHGFLEANRAETAMLVVMQVGSADSARG